MMKNRRTARKVEAGSKKEWTVKEHCLTATRASDLPGSDPGLSFGLNIPLHRSLLCYLVSYGNYCLFLARGCPSRSYTSVSEVAYPYNATLLQRIL